jgi:hypothetical protein
VSRRPEKDAELARANQQLLKMLQKGLLTPEEHEAAQQALRRLFDPKPDDPEP